MQQCEFQGRTGISGWRGGNYYFNISPRFKDKCTIIYIKYAEEIKDRDRYEGYRVVDHQLSR